MFNVVIQPRTKDGQLIKGWADIVSSTTRSGATRKANGWLKHTFFVCVKRSRIDNYEYWKCVDVADLDEETREAHWDGEFKPELVVVSDNGGAA